MRKRWRLSISLTRRGYHASYMPSAAKSVSWWVAEFAAKPLAIAAFFVLLALLWTFPLQHVMAYPFVFLFFGAVMCSAWFGGFICGSMAVALSAVLVAFFFMPPLYSMAIGQEFRSFETAFVVCAIAITAVSAAHKRSETAVRSARDELELRVQDRTAELQKSNAELKERESHLRLLTEAIPLQIWRSDASGSIEYGNGDLLEYLGKTAEELSGDGYFEIFHPEDAALVKATLDEARRSGAEFETKARVRGADGLYRRFLIRGNPQLGEDGNLARWYGVHIDIEGQERTMQELLVAQERLSRLSRTLSMAEMAGSIAHELNQPLTALLTDAHACRRWLQAQPANIERATVTAERIVRETTRASEVMRRVRSLFSKSDYVREAADLNQLIRELVRLLRDEAIRRDVSIRMSLSDKVPVLMIDPVQIQQVLLNLITNGMDAMVASPVPRELEILTGMCSKEEVRVTVRDHGAGISAQARDRIFEPFFTTKETGTGIGLAICRTILEEHEGRIWAESLERGTAIHFTLRAKQK